MNWKKNVGLFTGIACFLFLAGCGTDVEDRQLETMLYEETKATTTEEMKESEAASTTETGNTDSQTAATETLTTTTVTAAKTATTTTVSKEKAATAQKQGAATTAKAAASAQKATTAKAEKNTGSTGGTTAKNTTDAESGNTTNPVFLLTDATTATTTTEPLPEDGDTYIFLDVAEAEGAGVVFSDGEVTITQAGTYHLSGSWGGTVAIEAPGTDKVKLYLEGAEIVSEAAPAISVRSADKLTLILEPGTYNTLYAYGVGGAEDAALFSRSDLTIKGGGELYAFCDNEHGIASNDDLKIEDSIVTVEAGKTGIFAHNSVTLCSSDISASGDNTGIRSRESLLISGGNVTACGGKKVTGERGGVISDTGEFWLEDCTLLAIGRNQTLPDGQTAVCAKLPQTVSAGTYISVAADGGIIAEGFANKKADVILCSSPVMFPGMTCEIYADGVSLGKILLEDWVTQGTPMMETEVEVETGAETETEEAEP